ncbi:MAG: HAD-IC family P-type ATPase, partial [Planctomycetales bacterium]|nr:HAD-IC family P-type ATPase [Planctomycetales bacterium]
MPSMFSHDAARSAGLSHAETCHYCGLPLDAGATKDSAVSEHNGGTNEPRYCCFGCRFAEAVANEKGDAGHVRWTLTRLGVAIFLSMNVMVFTLALWSRDVYVDAALGGDARSFHELFRYASLVLTVPVLFLLGGPLLDNILADWRCRSAATDLLLLVGVAASFIYSLASTLYGDGHVYFEVTCMVLVAVTLGRWLEATGKLKTTEALRALENLLPDTVRVIRDGEEIVQTLGEVNTGDTLHVLAGERIPVDGAIVRNTATIDQQAVTGESEPVVRQTGDEVFSGTLNLDGDLYIEATAPGGAGTLRRMIDAVAAAAQQQERYQRLADRIARWFLPAVLLAAAGTFALHYFWHDLPGAMLAALAVVLIACPCALGLATPMALWVALGRASRAQLLFRDGDSLTRLADVKVVCFDKTGTLTTGQAVVETMIVASSVSTDEFMRVAATLAENSNHTLSASIAEFISHKSAIANDEVDNLRTFAGRGVSGYVSGLGSEAVLGSERFLREQNQWDEDAAAKMLG